MSIEYDRYINTHKENVMKGFEWLELNLPEVINGMSIKCFDVIQYHDSSKTMFDEYDAYDKYFYGGNRSFKVVEDFNKAWLKHIHRNPHHWQHWVLINDEPSEGMKAIKMPYEYVIEMICDWWAFSWNSGDLKEIFNWYDQHRDYMKLSPKSRDTVEDILDRIQLKLIAIVPGTEEANE